jgi:hypothetical protein
MKTASICLVVIFSIIIMLAGFIYLRNNSMSMRHSFMPRRSGIFYYTCTKCGSTRHVDKKYYLKYIPVVTSDRIVYKAPGSSTCTHKWRPGISKAEPTPVMDGDVVLVRKSGKYGAFILSNQKNRPNYGEYEWWYQADGSGKFDKSSKTISTDSGIMTKRFMNNIEFADFKISWYASGKGKGCLNYAHFPGEIPATDDIYFCITKLKSLKGVDAADPKWKYKAAPK